ncbi:hypothetical protein TBLA_0J01280 [Henningerozyma blattae CBS 6284]|uniref:Golgi to ER traffic protein 2 n=1 Tax=Henningerozyma blattae (strain ATCC 34711 / CBS 6284 / DSM 70876 / NBRC 10599 / NRRL Y-10934 / UCD 77-7) TaxID=1071380 RepID=I2H9S2_HENB6|nr:hypothetical protein TBLA_0J01280 [Tetrapisispora blattae CBS 6284]CCH63124.1 hypothetical protein TBLA_0J01280 [Tetrapisispora blattae CBS 6284]
MTEISEAEKRRILRERRQKKFASGGAKSRLEKITGQAGSLMTTESPIGTNVKEATSELHSGNGASASLSRTAEVAKEKPAVIEDISNPSQQGKVDNPSVEIFKQLATNNPDSVNSTPDLFSLLGSMSGVSGVPNEPGLPDLSNFQMSTSVDQDILKYHNYLVDRLKVWSILIKWIFFLLPLAYLITRTEESSSIIPIPESLQFITSKSNFFTVFITFEIVATSIYYQQLMSIEKANKVDTLQNNSMILKVLSFIPADKFPIANIRSLVGLGLQYWDVLYMFLGDLCFMLVILGLAYIF